MSLSTADVMGCPARCGPFCVMKLPRNKMNAWAECVARDNKTCGEVVITLAVKFYICFKMKYTVGMSEYRMWSVTVSSIFHL
jgi:hypothetical protein